MPTKNLLITFFAFFTIAVPVIAQDLQVHEKYGVEIDFPEDWHLVGEMAYSSLLQTQLYFDRDTLHWIFLERFLHLSQIDKDSWHEGLPYGHPFDQAEKITKLDEANWPIDVPDLSGAPLLINKTGASIFLLQAADTASYVVFLARGASYVRLTIGTRAPGLNLNSTVVKDILQRIEISPNEPLLPDDPYTAAERIHRIENDRKKAKLMYKLVPADHPKYENAQRMLSILEQDEN